MGREPPVVHASACFSPGVAAINADGMLAGALGALAFAEHFARTHGSTWRSVREALMVSERAISGIRRRNTISEWVYFEAPAWLRTSGSRCMIEPLMRAYMEDFASVGSTA
jgi:hypothetical protein